MGNNYMKINLKKIIYDELLLKELEFFKQFNIYKTIDCKEYLYKKRIFRNNSYIFKERLKLVKVEGTNPIININHVKIIDTIEGTSIEGQHLTGKKLIIIGEINCSLVCLYENCNLNEYKVKSICLPFSTFIIIPKDICNLEVVNLRYIIEDVTIANLEEDKIIVSITPLIQYIDEYINIS